MFGLNRTPIDTSDEKIRNILTRGVEDILVKESLESKLKSGRQLRVKLGFDPTSPYIHIGRAIVLRKLRAFQDLGHQVVFIVGDFTAQIGDPSDKLEKRPMLTGEAIQHNLKTYKDQVGKIIDLSKAEFHYNSKWLSGLRFQEIAELAESFSVQQMSARRNFKDRFDKGEEVSLREFLYPLMQGYDSVAIDADVELGGFDQLFNVKAGRTVQKHYGKPEQDILTTQMLEGTDGRKMSSSWGNIIAIVDEPNDMYGKIMSVRDDLMTKYFLLCTDISEEEIKVIEGKLKSGTNPRDIKMRLAREIVTLYHSADAARRAEENFVNTFAKGGVPDDIKEVEVEINTLLIDVLLKEGLVESKSEFRRLESEGAITFVDSGEKIAGHEAKIDQDAILKIGKRRFIKIKVRK
jgi:tyrosyl-tRNA synthetase